MGIQITQKGAEIINDYVLDPSSKKSLKIDLAKAGWSVENGRSKNDGRIMFRSPSENHGYWAKDLWNDPKGNLSYFDNPAYYQCDVNPKGEKVEPACEMDGNMTEAVPASSLKGRILMAALYPTEVDAGFRRKYAKEIAALQSRLRGAGMKL